MRRARALILAAAILVSSLVLPATAANATHNCLRYSHYGSHQWTPDYYYYYIHAGTHTYLTGPACAYFHRDQAHYH